MRSFGKSNFPLDFKISEGLRVQIGKMGWAHPIDLADNLNTREWQVQRRLRRRLRLLDIAPDLRGKSFWH